MNTNTFYSTLSHLPLLRKSYILKIMAIACFGLLLFPWFTFSLYLLVDSSLNLNDNFYHLIIVILLATIVGIIITFSLLYWLLYPISLSSTALHQYLNEEQKSQLPTHFEDSVGQLMTVVQYAIKKLDLQKHQITHFPSHDPLTGILNRRAGEERLRQEMARARREGKQMLVALCDVKQLKKINEQFGHEIGDACLTLIVKVFSKSIRESDWIARWHGNQFLMVLWDFNHITPTAIFMRIQRQPIQMPVKALEKISLSIGAYEYQSNQESDLKTELETLLMRLDDALSQVKQTGHLGIVLTEFKQNNLIT
ncbi:MAG TPA: GGDEF domain-containing protein [Thiotrichaceae bacterium]|nr:GGDEF domain-containing protein [Thiotrichaceae bacterium]